MRNCQSADIPRLFWAELSRMNDICEATVTLLSGSTLLGMQVVTYECHRSIWNTEKHVYA